MSQTPAPWLPSPRRRAFRAPTGRARAPVPSSARTSVLKSGDNYVSEATFNPDASLSVEIGGVPATVTRNGDIFRATVPVSSVTAENVEAQWSLTLAGRNYVRRQAYVKRVKYYVISSERGPQQYAYVNASTNRTAADATPYTGAIEDLDANHQWIFARAKEAPGIEPENVNVFSDLSVAYYMYNKGTGTYITGPLNTSTFGYLTVGTTAEDRMRVKVESRAGGKYSFQFSESGIGNHCITTYTDNPRRWIDDPATFGIFQTGGRDNPQFRFNLIPIYE